MQIDHSATLVFRPHAPPAPFHPPKWYTQELQRDKPVCELCTTVFTTDSDLQKHLSGAKHQKRARQEHSREKRKKRKLEVEERKQRKAARAGPGHEKLMCRECKTFANSQADYANHLKGKRHLQRMQTLATAAAAEDV